MAADILLYDTTYVPVGDDQTQHLEFTRDIAQRMNNKFGELFTLPKPAPEQHVFFGKDQGLRIRDLQDPQKKMSKSDESGKGIIFMHDEPQKAAQKIMSATTDSIGMIHYDLEKQPGISNLLQILSLLSGQGLQAVIKQYEGQTQYGPLKSAVAAALEQFLTTFQKAYDEVTDKTLTDELKKSEETLNSIANKKLALVQKAVGLRG